jgi:hypothetical protein
MSRWRLGPYRAVGYRFVVVGEAADVVRARIEHGLAPLLDTTQRSHDDLPTYLVDDQGSTVSFRYRVRIGRRVLVKTDSTATAAENVFWHVNLAVVKADRGEHLILHAAGVQHRGVTVALPAPMESGKTTTAAGLLRAGFGYLTDEALVLDRTTWQVTPYPKSLALARRSLDAVGDVELPSYDNAERDWQWHVPWWDLGAAGVPGLARPDLVVFPAYAANTSTEVTPLAPGEAMLALAGSTFEFTKRPRRNLELLAALVEQVPAHRLSIGNLGEAVALVSELVAERAEATHASQRRTA